MSNCRRGSPSEDMGAAVGFPVVFPSGREAQPLRIISAANHHSRLGRSLALPGAEARQLMHREHIPSYRASASLSSSGCSSALSFAFFRSNRSSLPITVCFSTFKLTGVWRLSNVVCPARAASAR